ALHRPTRTPHPLRPYAQAASALAMALARWLPGRRRSPPSVTASPLNGPIATEQRGTRSSPHGLRVPTGVPGDPWDACWSPDRSTRRQSVGFCGGPELQNVRSAVRPTESVDPGLEEGAAAVHCEVLSRDEVGPGAGQ